jgi:hypothetical protein
VYYCILSFGFGLTSIPVIDTEQPFHLEPAARGHYFNWIVTSFLGLSCKDSLKSAILAV